jgi:MerR family transcriptional regulator, light-induced transcriptional regulator
MEPSTVSPVREFLTALLAGNRKRCAQIVEEYRKVHPELIELYEEVFKRSLYEVGALWESNLISVATEHLSTALIEALLNDLYEQTLPEVYNGRKIVAACVEGESHQVGIKMVTDVFEMHGWQSFFLGADVPTNELLVFLREAQPDLVALSLSVYFHVPKLEMMLDRIRRSFPELPIVIGGQAFRHGGRELLDRYPGTVYLPDLPAVEYYIRTAWSDV